MDNLKNSLLLLQPGATDAKLYNWYVLGGNVVIETIAQYLARVPIKQRSAGVPVTMQLPKTGYTSLGTYTVAEFKGGILANFDGHYYTFIGGLEDVNFVEIDYEAYCVGGVGDDSGVHILTLSGSDPAFPGVTVYDDQILTL